MTALVGAGFRSMTVAALLLTATAAWAGVRVAIQGPAGAVTPNTDFDVDIVVTEAGSAFNGIDLIVTYDPAALTLVPRSPLSLQEGTLMTAACSNRFHRFRPGADRDTIIDVLLCAGTSVTGPGQIYRLRFHAASTPQATTIRLAPASRIYQAGVAVTPVELTDATIGIGLALDATATLEGTLTLNATPNPFRRETRIAFTVPEPGPVDVAVSDVSGRTVRRVHRGLLPAGAHTFAWDGRTSDGSEARPGVYFVSVRTERATLQRGIVRIR